jgi:hypothetical protein
MSTPKDRSARRRPARLALALAFVALVVLPALPAEAHESRVVGDVVMVVGWSSEPTYAGFQNAAGVHLSEVGPSEDEEGPPISDADLQVEILFGDEASSTTTGPLPMEEAFSEPGLFEADIIPTRPGTYTYHVTGTAAGQAIDEFFTSSEDTFSNVNIPADIQFPEQDPTAGELAQAVERLSSRAGDGADSTALWIAIGSGVVALIALIAALRKRPAA